MESVVDKLVSDMSDFACPPDMLNESGMLGHARQIDLPNLNVPLIKV